MKLANGAEVLNGDRLTWLGHEYEVCYIEERTLRLAAVKGGRITFIEADDLLRSIKTEEIAFTFRAVNRLDGHPKIKLPSRWTAQDKAEVYYRVALIQGYIEEHGRIQVYTKANKFLDDNYKSAWEEMPADLRPKEPFTRLSASHFFRRMREYLKSNRNPGAVASHKEDRGNREPRFPPWFYTDVLYPFERDLRANKLDPPPVTYHGGLHSRLEKRLKHDPTLEPMPKASSPSLKWVQRRHRARDQYRKAKERLGSREAAKLFIAAGRAIEPDYVMEFGMADGKQLHIIACDDRTRAPYGEPCLTGLFELKSRNVLGHIVTARSYCAATLLSAAKRAFGHGSLTDPGGVPDVIFIDSGGDYISDSFLNLARSINFHPVYCRIADGNGKAYLERFWRTLDDFLKGLPGWFNPRVPGARQRALKDACLTTSEIAAKVNDFIERYYKLHKHSALDIPPLTAWKEWVTPADIRVWPAEELDRIARIVEARIITGGRVSLDNKVAWHSDALKPLEPLLGTPGFPRKVEVMIAEDDLFHVLVKDPRTAGAYIKADPVFERYQTGLSLYEHQLARKALLAKTAEEQKAMGPNALEKVRWEIWASYTGLGESPFTQRQIAALNEERRGRPKKDRIPPDEPASETRPPAREPQEALAAPPAITLPEPSAPAPPPRKPDPETRAAPRPIDAPVAPSTVISLPVWVHNRRGSR